MCGIAGLIGCRRDALQSLERMKKHMKDRGPDGNGTWSSEDGEVLLGHQRLAIVDLTPSGTQPFVSRSGRFVMTYNGEIYNYKDLARKMVHEHKVTSFRGTSDTEVLLEAIEAYGLQETLKYVKGMFAIGLYDRQDKTITLFRDRIGEKPLFYGFVNGAFAFASDIGCFREISGFENPIRQDVLGLYFTYGYIPAPYTIYEDVYELRPGMILTLQAPYKPFKLSMDGLQEASGDGYRFESYWSMIDVAKKGQQNAFRGTFTEAADELERLLSESIRQQMVADVPVGAFLSAGIDSATVVSLMQELSPGKVRSFTIGMNDPAYNEARFAREIAAHLGTEHTELTVTEEDALEVIPNLPFIFGEPFADSSQIPTYLVSRMMRDHVTVSLSGDGGDELFCGYKSYESVNRIWNKMSRIPGVIRKPAGALLLHSMMSDDPVRHDKSILLQSDHALDLYRRQYEELDSRILQIPATEALPGRNPRALAYPMNRMPASALSAVSEVNHQIMLADLCQYHPYDILTKVDRSAMAVSLETRVPLLDRDVVEFAWTLPIEYLVGIGSNGEREGKQVLREVLFRHVPRSMMDRPKKGFSIPIAKWLRQPQLRSWAETLLDESLIRRDGLLNPAVVQSLWKDFTERGNFSVQIWYILMFQAWKRENS